MLRPLYWLAGRIFSIWARPAIQPETPAELITGDDAVICYVLETGGLADVLALERACRLHGLPSPSESFTCCGLKERRRVVVLRRLEGFIFRRPSTSVSPRLKRLVNAACPSDQELLLVPVAIYWGRSPHRERSLFKLLFSEDWDVMGRTRKFFATVLFGRNTLLRFSHPLPLSSIISPDIEPGLAYRKVSRILRVHFRKRRAATVGPDLSNRASMVRHLLATPGVMRAIDNEAGDDSRARERAEQKARKYIEEIAADVSFTTVRISEKILTWLWNRIYDGIELQHVDRLHEVAKDRTIVYAPCHRSHFDYMLLSYIIYEESLQIPHIAAGINLNLPILGRFLRTGGAFFLRRSFKGNRLYAAVFDAYLHYLLSRGNSVEYFIEGTRSRTGRLLSPKGGMLVMTAHSYLRNPRRPIVFVPVYFGYERLIEGDSFISELGGAEKKKESLLGLLRSVKALREYFGKVYVNIGTPIDLGTVIDEHRPEWRDEDAEYAERPAWLGGVVDTLGERIIHGINAAAAVTPASLLAFVLLSTPKQKIGEAELGRQLQLSLDLLKRFRYSNSVTIPDMAPGAIIRHGESLGAISRSRHATGDVIHMTERTAVLMTYFRNNILHLLAVPAAVACCFIQGRSLEHAELQRLVRLIYPFMRKELSTRWDPSEIDDVTTEAIETLLDRELLNRGRNKKMLERPPAGSAKAYQLLMLGQSMVPMLQRFYLAIAILVQHGSGTLNRSQLESLCEQSAERLSIIYGLHSPDFFNRALFQDFIRQLQGIGVIRRNGDGMLEFDDNITNIGADARLVLGEEIRHSILSMTMPEREAAE